MQQTHIPSQIGTIIQDRYVIEDVLGKGGFSTVYLVRDLYHSAESDTQSKSAACRLNLFALKVLTEQDQQEKNRCMFEHVVLQWLDHPALPHIHRVFEDDNHIYMLMDYIAGPTLETLRRQQVGKRFSLEQVISLLTPVVAGITYLHQQQPPIIHRDIKPSNIIVSSVDTKAVLVDFGIAKEYDPDATITAIRHCSAGYGAPEQYSSMRTDQRTDIYGLAATCYTLLTGAIPTDALRRVTSLAGKEDDPLIPLAVCMPTLPPGVSSAIQRALAINNNERFATIEEFWQALQDTHETRSEEPLDEPVQDIVQSTQESLPEQQLPTPPSHHPDRTAIWLHLLLTCLLILGLGFWTYALTQHRSPQAQTGTSSQSAAIPQQKATTPMVSTTGAYSHLAVSYQGTIHSILTKMTTPMYLLQIQQSNQNIQGTFKGLNRSGSFIGVLDFSKHIFFTVGSTSSTPLFFQGAVRADGTLAGTYCVIDASGQCEGEYGVWSLTP